MSGKLPKFTKPWSGRNIHRETPEGDRAPYPLADCKRYSPAYCEFCIAEKEGRSNVAK